MASKVRVAIVGLGFGAEFIPIFQAHPDAEMYAICQRNPESLKKTADTFGVSKQYTNFDELIKDPNVDAVHINSPIPDHAWMAIRASRARCRWAPASTNADRSARRRRRAARST